MVLGITRTYEGCSTFKISLPLGLSGDLAEKCFTIAVAHIKAQEGLTEFEWSEISHDPDAADGQVLRGIEIAKLAQRRLRSLEETLDIKIGIRKI